MQIKWLKRLHMWSFITFVYTFKHFIKYVTLNIVNIWFQHGIKARLDEAKNKHNNQGGWWRIDKSTPIMPNKSALFDEQNKDE